MKKCVWLGSYVMRVVALTSVCVIIFGNSMHGQVASLKPVCIGPFGANTPFWVEVRVGNPNVITNLYGINFKLKSNKVTCSYVDGSAVKGDFLGTSPLTFFQGVDAQTVDMTVSKTSAPGVNGTGLIAKAQFKSSLNDTVTFVLIDAIANDPTGTSIPLSVASGTTTALPLPEPRGGLPGSWYLLQNYPNPFNPSTTIRYGLAHKSAVQLTVFNTLGQQVSQLVNGEVDAGYHEVLFVASGLSSGVYFYRLQAGTYAETRKLVLVQ